jgi:DNA polymerase-3 subunit epsilon
VQTLQLPQTGRYHRALADAEATAHLLIRIQKELRVQYGIESISDELLCQIQSMARSKIAAFMEKVMN